MTVVSCKFSKNTYNKMKFLLAPDSFKESMTAKEVCQAMEKGIKNVLPNAQIIAVPMADGGEGTTASLVDATHGQIITKKVVGPLGKKKLALIMAFWVMVKQQSSKWHRLAV